MDASFSPDNQFILSGHEGGSVCFYQADTGALVTSWMGPPAAATATAGGCFCCPRQELRTSQGMLVAAACESTLSLWTPDLQNSAL